MADLNLNLDQLTRSSSRSNRALSGVLFLGAVDAAYNAYSATNSSPQTSDVFGDDSRRASLLWYVNVGHVSAVGLAIVSSLVAGSLWPLAGFGVVVAQMGWLYRRAFNRAASRACGAVDPTSAPSSSAGLLTRKR
jgi:hypothetical protein